MGRKNSNRLADAENVLDACASAFTLIPLWALKRGTQWMPSDEALHIIEDAKIALTRYAEKHPANGNGNGR